MILKMGNVGVSLLCVWLDCGLVVELVEVDDEVVVEVVCSELVELETGGGVEIEVDEMGGASDVVDVLVELVEKVTTSIISIKVECTTLLPNISKNATVKL